MKETNVIGIYPIIGEVKDQIKYQVAAGTIINDGLEYHLKETDTLSREELDPFLKDYKRAKICGVFPNNLVFPRYVKLPPVSQDKLMKIIEYESEQNIPFPLEEVLWNYKLIEGNSNELSVLLAATKKENRNILFPELNLDVLYEPSDAIVRLYSQRLKEKCEGSDKNVAILYADARQTSLTFANSQGIGFSRCVPVSIYNEGMIDREVQSGINNGEEIDKSEMRNKIINNMGIRLKAEINRSINFYRSQQGKELTEIWTPHQELVEILDDNISGYPFSFADGLEEFSNGPFSKSSKSHIQAASAIKAHPNGIDLLGREKRTGYDIQKGIGSFIFGVGYVLAIPGRLLAAPGDVLMGAGKELSK